MLNIKILSTTINIAVKYVRNAVMATMTSRRRRNIAQSAEGAIVAEGLAASVKYA